MESNSICFMEFASGKKTGEGYTIQNGFKIWNRRIRQSGVKIKTAEDFQDGILNTTKLLIMPNPNRKFTTQEYEELKNFILSGGSILILLSEFGEKVSGSNINYFLEDFGIAVNTDSVIRTSFVKPYYHPKQVLVQSGGIMSEEFAPLSTSFVYPNGASLNVIRPAVPIMSSSNVSFPVNRPIGAFFGSQFSAGKIAVIGSVEMFTDKWINKENNATIADSLISCLLTDQLINKTELFDVDYPDYIPLPDTIALADRLKSTLQEGENEVSSGDIQSLFYDSNLYRLDNLLYPAIHDTFQKLDVPVDQLSLIKPNFETPLPPLKPGTFPPGFREPDGPSFELFDLDEALSSQRVRLAQIANRCRPDEIQDLEYMLNTAGEALSITQSLPVEEQSPLSILRYVFDRVVKYKMPH